MAARSRPHNSPCGSIWRGSKKEERLVGREVSRTAGRPKAACRRACTSTESGCVRLSCRSLLAGAQLHVQPTRLADSVAPGVAPVPAGSAAAAPCSCSAGPRLQPHKHGWQSARISSVTRAVKSKSTGMPRIPPSAPSLPACSPTPVYPAKAACTAPCATILQCTLQQGRQRGFGGPGPR